MDYSTDAEKGEVKAPIICMKQEKYKLLLEILYFCLTTFLILTITIAAVINISKGNNVEIFVSLLSMSVGVILPQPSIRSKFSSKTTS